MTKSYPIVSPATGVTRQVLADNEDLMMVSFRFEEGAKGVLHDHPHVQSTFVRSGRFNFVIGDQERALVPGDSLIIPSGVSHGCVCLAAGELIDCFTPRRDDFL
ncbi:cupin domain-containing protein [Ruegeria sp. SCSIO 43209]|uniref:cupin domain-containing protein n=1 Tax=Ruegeria sp. SCSIO 43209 TaxID=2793010 RepID=UPI001CA90354|nr:cupin domain-containing protein [Ruegeria sp. SCSIO 43209]UAB89851.1 cupin domain-containing protein [Ruegeria sp. SCSIO 43209]